MKKLGYSKIERVQAVMNQPLGASSRTPAIGYGRCWSSMGCMPKLLTSRLQI